MFIGPESTDNLSKQKKPIKKITMEVTTFLFCLGVGGEEFVGGWGCVS